MRKNCKICQKLAEIRINLSEQGKDRLVELLPKANLYFPNYSGVEKSHGIKKLALREYEIARLRVINSLFKAEEQVLALVLRQHVLPIDLAFQVSNVKSRIHDMLIKKTYAEQIALLRKL